MRPRIFVSSTFYDLKYIREDLANFIKLYDFESILFEDGDIGYTPGKKLDESCYEQMRTADMVILIIGGAYGSAASNEKEDDFQEYMSVTRREFQIAINESIPVFVFIDVDVYVEYGFYENNYDGIENKHQDLKFKATKNINVFRFIREIKGIGNISITEFKKTGEIKEFLSKQWADMFKNYLRILKENGSDKKIISAVGEMNDLIKRMDTMLDGIGKKILGNGEKIQYGDVVQQIEIEKICDILANNFQMDESHRNSKEKNVEFLLDSVRTVILNIEGEIDVRKLSALLYNKLSNRSAFTCKIEEMGVEDIDVLRLISDKKTYGEVKLKLIEKKYYNKIFGVSLYGE